MTHTAHGNIVGIAGADGALDPTGAILLDDVLTLAIGPVTITEPADGGPPRRTDPVIVFAAAGPVHGTDDTVSSVYFTGVDGATMLAAHLLDSIQRAAGDQALRAALDTVRRHAHVERERRRREART